MAENELKAFKCATGRHVLGQVVRNGSGIRQLLLYRHAIQAGGDGSPLRREGDDEVDVIAVVEFATPVKCDLCGKVRRWEPGQEALARLVERALERSGLETPGDE